MCFNLKSLLLVLLVFTSSGCTQTLQFKVIDPTSGASLTDVEVSRRKVTSSSYFQRSNSEIPVGKTDANGVIAVKKVSEKDVIRFRRENHYDAVVALIGDGKIRVNEKFSPAGTPWTPPVQTVTNVTPIITVPLWPR